MSLFGNMTTATADVKMPVSMNGDKIDKGIGATNDHHNDDTASSSTKTTASIETEEMNTLLDDDNEELVWYFSYGSNMNPEVFEKKRGIKCRDFKVCKVPGYVLTYAEAILPYIEPAFCTCLKRSALPDSCSDKNTRPDIHGVAFLINKRQYEHMLLTEGGWGYQEYRTDPFWNIGHYGEEEIECVPIQPECSNNNCSSSITNTNTAAFQETATPTSFKALTLVGLFGVRQHYEGNASKRYCDLVNIGAESSGLPTAYREYLKERHPAFEPPHCRRSLFAKIVYIFMAFPIFFFEFGSLQLCISLNNRKMKRQKEQKSESASSTCTEPAKRRQRFEDVLRPPWIVLKICFYYRTMVLERVVNTLLFDWCKFPNGFRNCCKKNNHNTADSKKSQ
jgi:hypothetical protein